MEYNSIKQEENYRVIHLFSLGIAIETYEVLDILMFSVLNETDIAKIL